MRRIAAAVLTIVLAVALATPAHAQITDQQISDAIEKMQQFLLSKQNKDGSWGEIGPYAPESSERGGNIGETALVTYALLRSGLSFQLPAIQQGLRYLREQENDSVYTNSLKAHVWATLPNEFRPQLDSAGRKLIELYKASSFDYKPRPNVSQSAMHYGVLGLWEIANRGGRVPENVWEGVLTHFLKSQNPDGGWGYHPEPPSYGSMTAAGLTVLYVAQQELFRDKESPKELNQAIERALAWFDKHYSPSRNPNASRFPDTSFVNYYRYAVERVALASGIRTMGGQDWFVSGATAILKVMDSKTGAVRESTYSTRNENIGTSFAVLFLSRGRVPVWVTKLQLPDVAWNNRPNDLYFLTRYLSDLGEQELNWQTVSLDLPASQFANAPVAYLSAKAGFELDDQRKANLRDYLDHGGLLLASAEGTGAAFTASVKSLAGELYPDYEMEPLPADHPLLNALYKVDPREAASIQRVSNGARDLILLTTRDWSRSLQADRNPGSGEIWELAANLYTLVSERGDLENRLVEQVPQKKDGKPKGTITYARAKHGGDWQLEPAAWEPLAVALFNRTGLELTRSEVALDSLSGFEGPLVHLAGVERVDLSDAEKAAIKDFVGKGGTVLVETIGGRGDFSVGVEEQLRDTFGSPATPLGGFESIISGDGLAGGVSAQRVLFRPYSVIRLSARTSPRLAAFAVDGRPAVIVSHEDLSLGALGVKRWGINGYQRQSARDLLINILLAAEKAKK